MKLLLAFLFTAITTGAAAQTVINDRNAVVRNVGAFSGIDVSNAIDLYISQSDEYSLAVSASEEKYRDAIKTEVRDGVLHIWYEELRNFRFSGNLHLKAYVSFKELSKLTGSGAANIKIAGTLKAPTLKLKLTGACEIVGVVQIGDMDVTMSGASTSRLKGNIENLKVDASGASDIKDYGLIVGHCKATLSGASDARLTVEKSISVRASGASSFYYKGNPEKKDISESGASSISKRD